MSSMWNSVKRLFWEPGDSEEPSSREQPALISEPVRALCPLREVPGVIGSLAVDPNGNLVACDMPPLFDDAALHQVATRILQLYAAVGSDGSDFNSATVAYQGYQLHVERLRAALLGVLTHDLQDRAALATAIRAVSQHLAANSDPDAA
jgi:hypothetical protein